MPPWVVNLCVEWRHLLFHSAKWCQSLSASSVQETHQVQCGQFQSGSSCKRFTHFVAGWNFLKRSLPSFLKMEFEGGESYWNFILKFHFCNHVAFAFQEEEVPTALDWMGSFLLPQAFNWQHLVESRAGKQFEGLSALLACSQTSSVNLEELIPRFQPDFHTIPCHSVPHIRVRSYKGQQVASRVTRVTLYRYHHLRC